MIGDEQDRILVLHAPVIHKGYIDFFRDVAPRTSELCLMSADLTRELSSVREIRAVDPDLNLKMIAALGLFRSLRVLCVAEAGSQNGKRIAMADEAISRDFAKRYAPDSDVQYGNVFLRWDEGNVNSSSPVKPSRISSDPFDIRMMNLAKEEASISSDWWRHVGAVVVREGKVIMQEHNRHLPTEQTQYVEGDPRDFIPAGTRRELSTAIHAEQTIVAQAARHGIALEGAQIYMSVFPCNLCAQLIVSAGIRSCLFETGNAYLNVEEIFGSRGVEIVRVES